jgi:uncharacterized protein (TIGR02391 family)
MSKPFAVFEKIARIAGDLGTEPGEEPKPQTQTHPFDERNIHPAITAVSLKLFDNGHYSQATFEAFKYVDKEVKKLSNINDSGFKLMMAAFAEAAPKIKLTALKSQSEIDEQMGYKFIFAGAMSAIRNPRGHEITTDPIDLCLDHLSFASVLLRRLEKREP